MTAERRALRTRGGTITFPAYVPVTTFGDKFPLDALIQPFLPRLASAVMVSYHYARSLDSPFALPLMIDSGGFAALLDGARVVRRSGLGVLELTRKGDVERVHPNDVLEVQETHADVAFTLDFPIPSDSEPREARRRLDLTLANAYWAAENRRRRDLPLYACIPTWDVETAAISARELNGGKFSGIAIGGLVPRARNVQLIRSIIRAIRGESGDLPLHVFGLGSPANVKMLFQEGVDSVDSSSYVQAAAQGRLWSDPSRRILRASQVERLHLALCNLAAATGNPFPLSSFGIAFDTVSAARTRAERQAALIG